MKLCLAVVATCSPQIIKCGGAHYKLSPMEKDLELRFLRYRATLFDSCEVSCKQLCSLKASCKSRRKVTLSRGVFGSSHQEKKSKSVDKEFAW